MQVIDDQIDSIPLPDLASVDPRAREAERVLMDIDSRFRALEEAKNKVFEEMKRNPPIPMRPIAQPQDEDMITKRNAAMIVLGYISQKKQFLIISIGSALIIAVGTIGGGPLIGFGAFAAYSIYSANLFLKNEKELKEMKLRFGI